MYVSDGSLLAGVDAIEAHHATAIVDGVVLRVDASGLAIAGTESAGVALAGVDDGLQPREAGEESQHGAHGADGVAIGSSVAPSQHAEDDEGEDGHQKGGAALDPYFGGVEGVAFSLFGKVGEEVVSPQVEGGEEVGNDASPSAIGCQ